MLVVNPMKYLYVPSICSTEEQAMIIRAFVSVGYDARRVCMGDSLFEVVAGLPDGVGLVVYSINHCGTFDQLLGLLTRLQERRILLCSLREPWVNEAIRDHAYCIEKLRNTMGSFLSAQSKKMGGKTQQALNTPKKGK